MRGLLSRQGIRYTCQLLTENSKRAFLMLVTKIQCPKILKWKKKSINNKKKPQKMPASSMTPACAFSMNQSSVQAIHSEGKGPIPVPVACFIYSITEV